MRLLASFLLFSLLQAQDPFLVKPYLQLGDAPRIAKSERLDLLWQTEDRDGAWTVEVQGPKGWQPQAVPTFRTLNAPPLAAHRIYRSVLRHLAPGQRLPYRLKLGGQVVFESTAQARKAGAHRLVVFGDAANGSKEQSAIAQAVAATQPDAVFITGDLVYGRGRASEYRDHFFPVYNSEAAPLLRSIPFIGVVGNHDVPFAQWPDASAFFAYWSLPLNGPALKAGEPNAAPAKAGVHDAMVAAAGPAFPRMGSFSFDYGQVHWTVLDSNRYADWESPALKAWLEADLKAAQHATWRIVALHHPLFQSAKSHEEDQWMRPISRLLEKYHVDLVLAGHVHNYQRTAPLRFQPTKIGERGRPVEGNFQVDEAFDGQTHTRAQGIIHIVTGAGGAELYDPWQTDAKTSWQPWTRAFVSDQHSFTVLDVDGKTLKLRQLNAAGRELDAITMTK